MLIGAGAALAVLAIVGFALPGRASTTGLIAPLSTAPATAASNPAPEATGFGSAAASGSATNCATQAGSWAAGGGTRGLDGLASSIGSFGDAMTRLGDDLDSGTSASADEATVKSDAAQVQTAARTIQSDPAPACVPGLRADLNGAAAAYSTSAVDATNGLNELSSDDLTTANQDIQAAAAAISQGNTRATAASTDINKFDSQG